MYSHEEQDKLNRLHVEKPKVGDFWHERYCPYFIVIEVTKHGIIVLDKTLKVDEWHYRFDESKPRLMTLQDLRDNVTYSTMRDKFVANVRPGDIHR